MSLNLHWTSFANRASIARLPRSAAALPGTSGLQLVAALAIVPASGSEIPNAYHKAQIKLETN
jgi:hypothetical protein